MSMKSMGHRVLFDTNTLIDAVNSTRAHSEAACQALEYCNGGGDMGIVSPSSLNDATTCYENNMGNLGRERQSSCCSTSSLFSPSALKSASYLQIPMNRILRTA